MPIRRWGEDVPDDADAARRRLIDAAEACFERHGLHKTTLDDVANEASVSRATVYRYFSGGRDEIVLAVLLREGARYLSGLARELRSVERFTDFVVEVIVRTVDDSTREPRLALLVAPDVAGEVGAIAGASEAVFEGLRTFLQPRLEMSQARGEVAADLDLDDVVEFLQRVATSLLVTPSPRGKPQLRRFLTRFLAPPIERPPDT